MTSAQAAQAPLQKTLPVERASISSLHKDVAKKKVQSPTKHSEEWTELNNTVLSLLASLDVDRDLFEQDCFYVLQILFLPMMYLL